MQNIPTEELTTQPVEKDDAVEKFIEGFQESPYALFLLKEGFALHEAIKRDKQNNKNN